MKPSTPKPLPFKPETLPSARQRYEDAIRPLYSVDRIRQQQLERPGAKRKHVFDFKSGIRLIITREHAPLAEDPNIRGPFLHVGAKIMEGRENMNGSQIPIGEMIRAFLYISKAPHKIKPLWSHISSYGVLHLLFKPPFKGEYREDVPMNWIQRHETHRELVDVLDSEIFDPRTHCSICRREFHRTEQS